MRALLLLALFTMALRCSGNGGGDLDAVGDDAAHDLFEAAGDIGEAVLPDFFRVDYVRVYDAM